MFDPEKAAAVLPPPLLERLKRQNIGGESGMGGLIYEIFFASYVICRALLEIIKDADDDSEFFLTHQSLCFVDDLIVKGVKGSVVLYWQYQCKSGKSVSWKSKARGKTISLKDCFELDSLLLDHFQMKSHLFLVVTPENVLALKLSRPQSLENVEIIEFEKAKSLELLIKTSKAFANAVAKISGFEPDNYDVLAGIAASLAGEFAGSSRVEVSVRELVARCQNPYISKLDASLGLDGDFRSYLEDTLRLDLAATGRFLIWSHKRSGMRGRICHEIGSELFVRWRDLVMMSQPAGIMEFRALTPRI